MGKGNAVDNSRGMKRLKDEQQVRQRPAVIFGTNSEEGAFHGVLEVIANSIDEAREGYGKEINVTVEMGNVITVEDYGRGIPMGWNEDEQMYNWELALCTLYASGKYDDSQYGQSLGLNGLGLTATQFASEFMEVWSKYDGYMHYMKFIKGRPVGTMTETKLENATETGTKIKFKPDPEVFPALVHKSLDATMFTIALTQQAMLNDDILITLNHYELKETVDLRYERGAYDFLSEIIEKPMLKAPVEFTGSARGTDEPEINPEEYNVNFRLTFTFCRDEEFGGIADIYHNASLLSKGGTSVDGFEKGITNAFIAAARAKGKLQSKESFLFRDISSILVCIATSDAPGNRTWFENQTKKAINNPFIGMAMRNFVTEKVKFWLDNNPKVADKIIDEVVANKKAREEGNRVSRKLIQQLNRGVSYGNKPEKFIDCTSKNVFERELYIVEGDSALGSVKLSRDARTQAIIPVRGKILNCLKSVLTQVLGNQIITDIFRVLGCGLEVESEFIEGLPKFDITKLNYNKIIICTDADIDGYHIRTLLITMFYRLAPSLLKSGKVFIADSPLFEIIYKLNGETETFFAYTEAEKEKKLAELEELNVPSNKIKINRSKGLGENDPEMMALSTMNAATRRLITIEYPEVDDTLKYLFSALLGDDIETRRELIDEYFSLVDIDIE